LLHNFHKSLKHHRNKNEEGKSKAIFIAYTAAAAINTAEKAKPSREKSEGITIKKAKVSQTYY